MELNEWKAAGYSTRYRGYPVYYRDEGSGDALLLIHGYPTASYDWCRIWPRLTPHFRVLAPDLIGFGFSAKPTDYDYRITDQADLCLSLLRERGVTEVHILAHDYGDSVAQEILSRYHAGDPAVPLLHSVCFLNGGLFPETHHPLFIQKLLLSPLGPLISRLSTESIVKGRFLSIFGPETRPDDREWKLFWELINDHEGRRIQHRLIRYMDDRRTHRNRWLRAMQQTKVPMRLINGPVDPISGRHLAKRYTELIPHPDVIFLEGIGHYPQWEDPAGVWNAFTGFLNIRPDEPPIR